VINFISRRNHLSTGENHQPVKQIKSHWQILVHLAMGRHLFL